MIVCNNREDYEILLALRSHGWSRSKHSYAKNAKKYPNLDSRYIFINSGFNVRPTDVQAAMGLNQFKRLNNFKKNRSLNKKKIIKKIQGDKRWNNQFSFINFSKKINPSYMNLPILVNKKYKKNKKKFLKFIEMKGLETRPIISGSFVNQPATKLYNLNPKKLRFNGAQEVEDLGFVIGLYTTKIKNMHVKNLVDILYSIDNF